MASASPQDHGGHLQIISMLNPEPLRFLAQLRLIDQRAETHPASWHMAVDEALLRTTAVPVLRIYRWRMRTVSLGYFLSGENIPQLQAGEVEHVRRWTGGGCVVHDHDLPYSLIVPSGEILASQRAAVSYQIIHAAIVQALRAQGIDASLADQESGGGVDCFQHAVPADVIGNGGKLAGAGQRRTRQGLLHQGSIHCPELVGEGNVQRFVRAFAQALCSGWTIGGVDTETIRLADSLEVEKYANPLWQRI